MELKLTGEQYKQLLEALMDAYPHVEKLRQMLRFQLDKHLDTIGGNLNEIVFKLIQTSQAEGWTAELIEGARKFNPGNALLKAFAEEFFNQRICFSVDGTPIGDEETTQLPPREEFDLQSFSARLNAPSGVVRLQDELYVKRSADTKLRREIVKCGTTITIHAPRQTGKTSLLARGIHHARQSGATVILLNFYEEKQLNSLNAFLYGIATTICYQLGLDDAKVKQAWLRSGTAALKLTYFLEDEVLSEFEGPIVLAIDKADDLLSRTSFYRDFFGMVRSWHEQRAFDSKLWGKLNIVLVISTEPYLLIDDNNQSPFNVGVTLNLEDFTETQVEWLNQQHGSPVTAKEMPKFMELLGGQPYLTRQALYTLLTENLSWNQLYQTVTTDQGLFGHYLRRLYSVVCNHRLKKALKQVTRSSRCSDDNVCFGLLQAGLIKQNNGGYTCRCGLYKQYFEKKLL